MLIGLYRVEEGGGGWGGAGFPGKPYIIKFSRFFLFLDNLYLYFINLGLGKMPLILATPVSAWILFSKVPSHLGMCSLLKDVVKTNVFLLFKKY